MIPTQPPVINPELKFAPTKPDVISPPEIYQYSMQNELKLRESHRRELLKSAWANEKIYKQSKAPRTIFNILKATAALVLAYGVFRYRRSLPLIKKLFKKPPTKPLPNFVNDMKALYKYLMRK